MSEPRRWFVTGPEPRTEGSSTDTYLVRERGRPEWDHIPVWVDPGDSPRCVECSGPLSAMLTTCAHAQAVKRHLAKLNPKPKRVPKRAPDPEPVAQPAPEPMPIWTREQVESWGHSPECLEQVWDDPCICGLAALRDSVSLWDRPFHLATWDPAWGSRPTPSHQQLEHRESEWAKAERAWLRAVYDGLGKLPKDLTDDQMRTLRRLDWRTCAPEHAIQELRIRGEPAP